MEPARYPSIALNDQFIGNRKRGQPKNRRINNIEDECNKMGLNMVEALCY